MVVHAEDISKVSSTSCIISILDINLYIGKSNTENWIEHHGKASPYLPSLTRTVKRGIAMDAPMNGHMQN